jgi:hypothetical protein
VGCHHVSFSRPPTRRVSEGMTRHFSHQALGIAAAAKHNNAMQRTIGYFWRHYFTIPS